MVDAETITAISRLWPLAGIVFLTVCVVLFRTQIRSLLDRASTFRVKRGNVEAELSATAVERTDRRPTARHEGTAASEEAPTPEEELEPLEMEPASAREWAEKMLADFRDGDLEAAQAAFTETQQAEDDPVKKLQYKALYTSCRYEEGDTSALGELQQLAEQDGVATIAYPLLAECYENAGDFKHAAKSYQIAAQHADSEEERAEMVVQAAICLFRDGKQQDAYTVVMKETSESTAAVALSRLYEGLGSLYKLDKDPVLTALALEKALEFTPNDIKLRFRAAHSYGEKNLVRLSLLHYNTLLQLDPHQAGSLNNIGVAYSRLQMPIRAIQSYKAATRVNLTRAAGNLALSFLEAGFAEEARQSIEEAKQNDKTDAQVGRAITAISEMEEEEAKKADAYLDGAREQQRFLLSFAHAYFTGGMPPLTFAGTWSFPDGTETTLNQSEDRIEASWDRDDWEYGLTGRVNNRGAKITTHKMRKPSFEPPRLGVDEDGYAYLSSDDKQLFIMTIEGHEHSFQTLTRSEDDF